MNKLATILLMMILSTPLFADPSVTLKSTSMGYPYTSPFTVNVTFSEPVVGFGPAQVNVTNGTVNSVSGSQATYNLIIQPSNIGQITISVPANSVSSASTGAPNTASNTLKITALNPNVPPSSNFDLSHWSLTLPIPLGSLDNAISIGSTTLVGIPQLNTGYSKPPYFYTNQTTGAMSFFAPLDGATTPNSSGGRSELLEILPGSSTTWKLSTFASNTMSASLLAKQVPPVGKRIIIGQIHDKGNTDVFHHSASNSPLLKIYYDANVLDPNKGICNGCVYAQIRKTPAQSSFFTVVTLLNNTPLNTLFNYQVTLLKNGALTVKVNNKSTVINLSTSNDNTIGWGTQSLYFKAGVYNDDEDGGSSTLGSIADFYALQVNHV